MSHQSKKKKAEVAWGIHELRTLTEHSPDIIARFDRDGRYLYVNAMMEKVTGIPVQELLGQRVGERLSAYLHPVVPEEVLALRQAIDQVFTTGDTFETETHVTFADGEHVFNVRLIPETKEVGAVVSVLLVARDITEQKQAEQAFRAREERLQLALDTAQMGQWDWNIATGEVMWSPKCLAIYGLPPDASMSYERFLQALHPEDRERIDAALHRAVEERTGYDELKRAIWPDGSIHWTASRGKVYCDAAGQPVRMIGVTVDITDWKQIEQALVIREQQYRTLLENVPDLIVRYDTDLRRTYVNPAWEKASGLAKEEVVHVPAADIQNVPNPIVDAYVGKLRRVLVTGTPQATEFTWVNAKGVTLYLDYVIVPEYDRSGKIVGVLAVGRDLTERKQAEKERQAHLRLLVSMDRVNRAMQGTNDLEQMMNDVLDVVLAIFVCDRAWLIYPCDPEATSSQSLMERTRPEFPGALALRVKVPMDPDIVRVFKTVRDASGPLKFGPGTDHPLPEETKKQFSVQSQMAMAIYPKTGEPWMFGLHQCAYPRVWTPEEERLFQEIGRRVADALTSLLVYRNLHESEHRLEEAGRIAHVGWWDRDYEDSTITLSDETCRIFGLPLEKQQRYDLVQLHQRWQELIHPEDRPKATRAAAEALSGGPCYDLEYRVVRPDGEMRSVHSRGDVTWDASGRPRRMFGIMQDITELRRTEDELRRTAEELQRHREHLEEQVATRTAELAAAKVKAEEADRLKSSFLATMSHELRTPLNSILGFTGILLQGMAGPLNDEQRLQLGMVKGSARRLLDLINDILDLSKIEAGQVELRPSPFDMTALIEKTVQTLKPLAEKKRLELLTDNAAPTIEVFSDAHRVEQILINLVNNAIKFTEHGQVCIECRIGNGSLLIRVADTGIGIKPEEMKNLFATFRQIDSTLGRRHEGTGLGLSICQKLAGLLGGEIRVDSTWGVGSTFSLVLPREGLRR